MAAGVHELQGMVFLSLSIFVFFFAIQRISKVTLERDQYQYLKDVCLLAAWGICGVWSPDPSVRLVVAMGLLAAIFGVGQRVNPKMPWSLLSLIHISWPGMGRSSFTPVKRRPKY